MVNCQWLMIAETKVRIIW